MRSKFLRRATAMLLCAAMLLCTPAMAASDEGEVPEEAPVQSSDIPAQMGTPDTGADTPTETVETPPGGESSVEVRAMSGGVEPFSVTLPTSLSVTIGADGSHVSQTARIENTGAAVIKVTDVSCTPANGWMLRDYDNMDPNVLPLGEHSVGFKIRQAGCTSYSKSWDVVDMTFQYYEDSFAEISYGNSAALEFEVCIPAQSRAMTVKLIDVTFVVSAYHNYSLEVTAQNSGFVEVDYFQCPLYQQIEAIRTDTFSVTVYDNGVPLATPPSEWLPCEWYSVETYSTNIPDPSADWQYIQMGNNLFMPVELYGMGNVIFLKACWNGYECVVVIPSRGQ